MIRQDTYITGGIESIKGILGAMAFQDQLKHQLEFHVFFKNCWNKDLKPILDEIGKITFYKLKRIEIDFNINHVKVVLTPAFTMN